MRTLTDKTALAFTVILALALAGCGNGSVETYFTPKVGKSTYEPNDFDAYAEIEKVKPKANGDGWSEGWYDMGYGPPGGGAGGFCLGAACHCPPGWTSATFESSMLLTDPSASGAFLASGKAAVIMENEVWVNSTSSSAVSTSSNSHIEASEFNIAGNHAGPLHGPVYAGVVPMPDPLQFLPYPDDSELEARSYSGGNATLQPGKYTGGLTISGATVELLPGLYYLEGGGFSVSSGAAVTGTEVTLFIADSATSTISIQGGASVELYPPSDGHLQGMTVFFNRDNPSPITITGGGALNIYGTIYAPSATATLGGNGNMIAGSQIVASRVSTSGNSTSLVTTANGLITQPPGCFAP